MSNIPLVPISKLFNYRFVNSNQTLIYEDKTYILEQYIEANCGLDGTMYFTVDNVLFSTKIDFRIHHMGGFELNEEGYVVCRKMVDASKVREKPKITETIKPFNNLTDAQIEKLVKYKSVEQKPQKEEYKRFSNRTKYRLGQLHENINDIGIFCAFPILSLFSILVSLPIYCSLYENYHGYTLFYIAGGIELFGISCLIIAKCLYIYIHTIEWWQFRILMRRVRLKRLFCRVFADLLIYR